MRKPDFVEKLAVEEALIWVRTWLLRKNEFRQELAPPKKGVGSVAVSSWLLTNHRCWSGAGYLGNIDFP